MFILHYYYTSHFQIIQEHSMSTAVFFIIQNILCLYYTYTTHFQITQEHNMSTALLFVIQNSVFLLHLHLTFKITQLHNMSTALFPLLQNTIRDGGSTTLYSYTLLSLFHCLYTVNAVYTIQTA